MVVPPVLVLVELGLEPAAMYIMSIIVRVTSKIVEEIILIFLPTLNTSSKSLGITRQDNR